MLSLGIIGHYLARIYEEVKGRPKYIIRSMTENIQGDMFRHEEQSNDRR